MPRRVEFTVAMDVPDTLTNEQARQKIELATRQMYLRECAVMVGPTISADAVVVRFAKDAE